MHLSVSIARGLTTDQLTDINQVLARPVNPNDLEDLNRPPTIVSQELRQQLTQGQIDELERNTDPTVQLTEAQEQQVQIATVVSEDTEAEAFEGVIVNIEGEIIEANREIIEVPGG